MLDLVRLVVILSPVNRNVIVKKHLWEGNMKKDALMRQLTYSAAAAIVALSVAQPVYSEEDAVIEEVVVTGSYIKLSLIHI